MHYDYNYTQTAETMYIVWLNYVYYYVYHHLYYVGKLH